MAVRSSRCCRVRVLREQRSVRFINAGRGHVRPGPQRGKSFCGNARIVKRQSRRTVVAYYAGQRGEGPAPLLERNRIESAITTPIPATIRAAAMVIIVMASSFCLMVKSGRPSESYLFTDRATLSIRAFIVSDALTAAPAG